MRIGALALVLLATACGRGDGGGNAANISGNAASAPTFAGEDREAAATVALAASGPGGCSARWDGQPATPQQVFDRSSALIDRAIQQQGGVANLTEQTLPIVAVTAPANLGFACADTYLSAIRRSGVRSVLLALDGGRETALADFTLSDIGAPPPSVALALRGGGRLSWNNETIALAAIPQRLRQLVGSFESGIEAPPGELELRPGRDATFGQLHAVLSTIRAGHIRAAVLLPSVERSPPPAPAVTPPPAPLPPVPAAPSSGNEAAPRP
jgi:hypothetical protein